MTDRPEGYNQGWGDCKAQAIKEVIEALRSLHEALQGDEVSSPTGEQRKELRLRVAELQRMRAILKSLSPDRRGRKKARKKKIAPGLSVR